MLKMAVRNFGGALHLGRRNRYRDPATQADALADAIATGAHVLLLQEVTGGGPPFDVPAGWRFHQPYSKADRGAASVVVVAGGVGADPTWRPEHPVLDAFGAYLDFGLLNAPALAGEVVLASVHASRWQPHQWATTGRPDPMPRGVRRPWPSDVILDALIDVLAGREAVLAGDWNEDLDYPAPGDRAAAAFEQRARDAGLVEAVSSTFKGKVRTNFADGTTKAYQNDKVFLTPRLAAQLRSVAVWHEPGARLGDHAGLTVTIDI